MNLLFFFFYISDFASVVVDVLEIVEPDHNRLTKSMTNAESIYWLHSSSVLQQFSCNILLFIL